MMRRRILVAVAAAVSVGLALSVRPLVPIRAPGALAGEVGQDAGIGSEGRGYRAEITVKVTGPGDDFTYRWVFDDLQLWPVTSGYRPEYRCSSGAVSVTGKHRCIHKRLSSVATYSSRFDLHHTYDDPNDTVFRVEFLPQDDSDEMSYWLWVGGRVEYATNAEGTVSDHNGTRPVTPRDFVKVRKTPYLQIGTLSSPREHFFCGGHGWNGWHYVDGIKDHRAYTVAKSARHIQGQAVYPLNPSKRDPCEYPATVTLTWNIYLGEVEVEIEQCEYDWRPEKDGDNVTIKARMVKPEGAEPKWRFTLYDISAEPGHCMNAGDEEGADLELVREPPNVFAPTEKSGGTGGAGYTEVMETPAGHNEIEVQVKPLDYGAYGKLKAEACIYGIWYPAHVVDGTAEYINIPRDDNENHIADCCVEWDQAGGGGAGGTANDGGGGAAADADEDPEPEGDGTTGDGLTNYEEYRGYRIQDEWQMTYCDIKDLFVLCASGSRLSQGVDVFAAATGLEIHKVYRRELGGEGGLIINYKYSGSKTHRVDQHAIPLYTAVFKNGDQGRTYYERSPPRSPKDILVVGIDYANEADELTVAHELGHCVGIQHHGDGNYSEHAADLLALSAEGVLHDPVNTALRKLLENIEEDYYIAVWGGENSGNETCFMRYDSADYYQRQDGTMYEYYEPTGLVGPELCESPLGTGINGPPTRADAKGMYTDSVTGEDVTFFFRVLPMCGDATRGACLKQIHVTDDPEKERNIPERPPGEEPPPVEEYTDEDGKTYYPPLEDEEEDDDEKKRAGEKEEGGKKTLRELKP